MRSPDKRERQLLTELGQIVATGVEEFGLDLGGHPAANCGQLEGLAWWLYLERLDRHVVPFGPTPESTAATLEAVARMVTVAYNRRSHRPGPVPAGLGRHGDLDHTLAPVETLAGSRVYDPFWQVATQTGARWRAGPRPRSRPTTPTRPQCRWGSGVAGGSESCRPRSSR